MSDEGRIIYYGVVLDNNDPANLGRLIVQQKGVQQQNTENALPTNLDDRWSTKNPFLTYPLLPIFLYQIPKVGEYVHIIYYKNNFKENNRFYIQGKFSNINDIDQSDYDSMVAGLSDGERNQLPNNVNTNNTSAPVSSENWGLYPIPKTIGLLGRNNSDVLLPEGGFMARANKEFKTPDGTTFNKKYSFMMLQNYQSRTTDRQKSESVENYTNYPPLNYLIEYNVYGGMGIPKEWEETSEQERLFTGYVEIYAISKYKKVSTTAFTSTDVYVKVDEESKIGPIYRKDFLGVNFNTITGGIRGVIKNLNGNNIIGLPGEVIKTVTDTFPFVFQPSKSLFDLSIGNKSVERENAKDFIKEIFLNVTDFQRGFGLVCQKNTLGPLVEARKVEVESPITDNRQTTVGMNAADFFFLLSHESQIPGLNKIEFQNLSYSGISNNNLPEPTNIINQNFIWDSIYPNTNSMVRGEKLLALLELIVNYMINHVHPFHNMPPNPVAKDQTSSQQVLTEMFNGYEYILNQKLRIN